MKRTPWDLEKDKIGFPYDIKDLDDVESARDTANSYFITLQPERAINFLEKKNDGR